MGLIYLFYIVELLQTLRSVAVTSTLVTSRMELIFVVEDLKSISCLLVTANTCMTPSNDQHYHPNKNISVYLCMPRINYRHCWLTSRSDRSASHLRCSHIVPAGITTLLTKFALHIPTPEPHKGQYMVSIFGMWLECGNGWKYEGPYGGLLAIVQVITDCQFIVYIAMLYAGAKVVQFCFCPYHWVCNWLVCCY